MSPESTAAPSSSPETDGGPNGTAAATIPLPPTRSRAYGLRVMATLWVWMVMGVVAFSMVYADQIQAFFSDANHEMTVCTP